MKIFKTGLLNCIFWLSCWLISATMVLAVVFSFSILVQETAGNSYDMIGVSDNRDVEFWATNGYTSATGTDLLVDDGAVPRMLQEDAMFIAVPVSANSSISYDVTTNNTPEDFAIIPGYGGYVTVADNASLEHTSNFTDSISGYFDTTQVSERIFEKPEALIALVSGSGNVTTAILDSTQELTGLSANSTWNHYDATGYISSAATGVILEMSDSDGTANAYGFRKTGSTDDRRTALATHIFIFIGVDDEESFDYWLTDADQHVYLRGYTTSEWTFNTNGTAKAPGADAAWTAVDCSANVPVGTKAVILEVVCGAAARAYGLRQTGSTDARTNNLAINHKIYAIVGLDASRTYQTYEQTDAGVTAYLIGYVTDGMVWKTNGIDKSTATTAAWADIDCSANVTNGQFAFLEMIDPGGTHDFGLRTNGSIHDIYQEADSEHYWGAVNLGTSGIYEQEISTNVVDTWLMAYTTTGVYPAYVYDAAVTAPVASGERNLTAYADSVNLGLSIDGGAAVTVALAGASVPDNSANWIVTGLAMPYATSINMTIGGNHRIQYQPDDYIRGTTLPNELNPGTYDGTFVWGSNPAGITLTFSSMAAEDAVTGGGGVTITSPDAMGRVEEPEPIHRPNSELEAPAHEYYALVSEIASMSHIPVFMILMFISALFAIGVMSLVRKYIDSIWAAGLAACVVMGLFVAMGAGVEWWMPAVVLIGTAASALMQRSPTV